MLKTKYLIDGEIVSEETFERSLTYSLIADDNREEFLEEIDNEYGEIEIGYVRVKATEICEELGNEDFDIMFENWCQDKVKTILNEEDFDDFVYDHDYKIEVEED